MKFAASLIFALANASADVTSTSMGHFSLKNAAFPSVAQFSGSERFLLCSSFGALSSGSIYVVPGLEAAVKTNTVSKLQAKELKTPSFQWPNNVATIPEDVFGQRAIVVPDGFLVPGKSNGGVYVVTMDASDITLATGTFEISPKKSGYFYHMGEWIDMNGDGRKDFVTARSNAKAG